MKRCRHIHSSARAALVLAVLATAPALASGPQTKGPELKTFKDWKVGCDNIRSCTAIGLSPTEVFSGYVVVKRDGAGTADTRMSLVVRTEAAIKTPIELSILVDGAPVPDMSFASYPAGPDKRDTFTARLELDVQDVAILLHKMRNGNELRLKVTGAGRDTAESTVSLAGAAAALLYMDDKQIRTGTVTALVEPGHAPASSIPAVPPLPVLKSIPLQQVKHPPTELPKGITPVDLDDCAGSRPPVPDVIRLSPQLELWGVCYVRGAYNEQTTFWLVGQGGVKQASFVVPGGKSWTEGPAILENAGLSEDGRSLDSSPEGRGLGDCGARLTWVWTGSEFQLAHLAEMDDCKGVFDADWPVTYTTQWK